MDYQTDLNHALRLADEADKITMRYYRAADLNIEIKSDESPVTQGDKEAEKRLRKIITTEFNEGFLGEESGQETHGGRMWIVDPIDGTKNFTRGLPLWGSLIALTENSETIAAAVSVPALGRRWWAAKGLGAWTRDVDGTTRQIRVSGVSDFSKTFLLTSTPLHAWDKVAAGEAEVQKLLDSVWRWRAPGDLFNYMWVAEGAADACFEPYAKQWDIEAPKLIVTEAGGTFYTDATEKTSPDEERAILASNGKLDSKLRKILKF